jgi:hypothetical protein
VLEGTVKNCISKVGNPAPETKYLAEPEIDYQKLKLLNLNSSATD